MKIFPKSLKLFIGIFSVHLSAHASTAESEFSENRPAKKNQTSRSSQVAIESFGISDRHLQIDPPDLLESGCSRLFELESKIRLTVDEVDEGALLEALIGQACKKPHEYNMASVAHKIKEL